MEVCCNFLSGRELPEVLRRCAAVAGNGGDDSASLDGAQHVVADIDDIDPKVVLGKRDAMVAPVQPSTV